MKILGALRTIFRRQTRPLFDATVLDLGQLKHDHLVVMRPRGVLSDWKIAELKRMVEAADVPCKVLVVADEIDVFAVKLPKDCADDGPTDEAKERNDQGDHGSGQDIALVDLEPISRRIEGSPQERTT